MLFVPQNFAGKLLSDSGRAIVVTLQRVFPQCRAFHDYNEQFSDEKLEKEFLNYVCWSKFLSGCVSPSLPLRCSSALHPPRNSPSAPPSRLTILAPTSENMFYRLSPRTKSTWTLSQETWKKISSRSILSPTTKIRCQIGKIWRLCIIGS